MEKFKCESIRLCRYLYSLGFDKTSIIQNGNEYWLFDKSDNLQESLDFYFKMRKRQELMKNEIQYRNCNPKIKRTRIDT